MRDPGKCDPEHDWANVDALAAYGARRISLNRLDIESSIMA